jgi:hypothetical protein
LLPEKYLEKKYLKKFFLFKKALPLTYRKQRSNRINLIKMKNFLMLLIGEDFTTADIIPAIKTFLGLIALLMLVSFIENL